MGNTNDYKFGYELHVKLRQGDKFFGKGVAQLLYNIEKFGSLQRSAAEMGLAYSKAWSIIKKAEDRLGFSLTQRKIGGIGGGGSSLTEEGKEFLKRFTEFENAVYKSTDKLFDDFFGDYRKDK